MKKNTPYLLGCLAALLLFAAQASAQTTVLFEGFENQAAFTNNWITESNYAEEEEPVLWGAVTNGFGKSWGASTVSRTGSGFGYCAAIGYLGTTNKPVYPDEVSTFMSRDIDLTGYRSATLTFWFQARIFKGNEDEFDEFFSDYLTVSVDGEPLYTTEDLDPEEGEVTNWRKVRINLEGFAGKVCNLKFEFESDFYTPDNGERMGILIDDIVVTGYPFNRPDYNKDGWLDLLFQNSKDNRVAIWYFTNFTSFKGSAYLRDGKAIPGSWKLAGQADFNGDGNADVFWVNDKGATLAWLMDGLDYLGYIPMKNATPSWSVVTLADFNNNGVQDILWQHIDGRLAVWFMNPTNAAVFSSSASLVKPAGTSVQVVGSGDFNYDGKRDLILQNTSNGSIRARYMGGGNGVAHLQSTDVLFNNKALGGLWSKAWRVVGTQDFDGDGEPDLIMHHTDGTIAAWHLNGLIITKQTIIRKVPSSWNVLGHR
jgi:hypothetical protein